MADPDFTLIELEQILNSREFQDQYTSAESQVLAEEFPSDLQGYTNHIISAVRRIISGDASGVGAWTDTVPASLTELALASGSLSASLVQINSFVGRADGDSLPTYSSTFYVNQSGSLETAISELDAAINSVTVASGLTWQIHFDSGSGILDLDMNGASVALSNNWVFSNATRTEDIAVFSTSGVLLRELGHREIVEITTNINPGDSIVLGDVYTLGDPTADTYRNLEVRFNGGLLSPGSGIVSGDEKRRDYRELNPTTIVTNRKLNGSAGKPGRLDIRILG